MSQRNVVCPSCKQTVPLIVELGEFICLRCGARHPVKRKRAGERPATNDTRQASTNPAPSKNPSPPNAEEPPHSKKRWSPPSYFILGAAVLVAFILMAVYLRSPKTDPRPRIVEPTSTPTADVVVLQQPVAEMSPSPTEIAPTLAVMTAVPEKLSGLDLLERETGAFESWVILSQNEYYRQSSVLNSVLRELANDLRWATENSNTLSDDSTSFGERFWAEKQEIVQYSLRLLHYLVTYHPTEKELKLAERYGDLESTLGRLSSNMAVFATNAADPQSGEELLSVVAELEQKITEIDEFRVEINQ